MIEFDTIAGNAAYGPPVGGGPVDPPNQDPPPSSLLHSASTASGSDTVEVAGQALDFPASSVEENADYAGTTTYSSAGQPLAATGGLLDISG